MRTAIVYQNSADARNTIGPDTWYPRPEHGQTAADIRLACSYARWEKIPGYQRTRSWDECGGNPPHANPDHTRYSWNNGYICLHGVDPALVKPRDRFGYWTVRSVLYTAGVYRDGTWLIREETKFICECDCGTTRKLGSCLLYGQSLSCGCWKAKNRTGHAQGCICKTCTIRSVFPSSARVKVTQRNA